MKLITSFVLSGLLSIAAVAQVPVDSHVAIIRAEDARRYDQTLEALLKSPNAHVRERASLAAGRIGDEAAIPILAEMLDKDPALSVRAMVAFALGEIESTKAGDAIVRALSPAVDPKKRAVVVIWPLLKSRLVEAAGKIAGAHPTDPKSGELRTQILNALNDEEVKGVRHDRGTVLLALTAALRAAPRDANRQRPDETDVVVAKFLMSPNARVRADAANTLARIRAKNANEVLLKMLASDVDPIARANAARALGAAEDKTAVDGLTKAATSDADQRVRVSAIRSLATLRDPKAAIPLLARGEVLMASYKRTKRPNIIPFEQNEFIEIATTLGRLLANTRNERAVSMFREFGRLDRGFSTEVYIARLRIAPGRGDNDEPELTHWRQYSTLARVVGEFATLEPENEEGKQMRTEAPLILGPLARAYAEADPVKDADTIKAGPDVLRAFAAFKTQNLSEVLRVALMNDDVFIRAAAAELLGDQPVTDQNLAALNTALAHAIINDAVYNDAVLAILDAVFKLDKKGSVTAIALAAGSLDQVVRLKVAEMLKDEGFRDRDSLPAELRNLDGNSLRQVRPHSGKFTKLGQVLNSDADYRRALSRRNGTVRAVVTTAKGAFTIELLPQDAPLTVDNFIKLARSGYFNGLEVHRVVPNFVMQDGDPRGDGNGGPGWSIRCEINTVPYERGVVGMALSGKDTGGSQWFVTHSPQPHLDGGYTVFGRVNEFGMKVVDKIVRGDKIVSVRIIGR